MVEVLVLLGRRVDKLHAAKVGDAIYGSRRLAIVNPDQDHYAEALRLLRKYADQPRLNYVDTVSFALMIGQRISTAFTFDRRDFEPAGFTIVP